MGFRVIICKLIATNARKYQASLSALEKELAKQENIMIDHVSLKVQDLMQSKSFYERVLLSLGYRFAFEREAQVCAFDIGNHCLFEIVQYNGESPITSTHVAFRAKSKNEVTAFYDAALAAGATDNGAPGPRPQYTKNYFACFVLDLDGHNIEVMCDEY